MPGRASVWGEQARSQAVGREAEVTQRLGETSDWVSLELSCGLATNEESRAWLPIRRKF